VDYLWSGQSAIQLSRSNNRPGWHALCMKKYYEQKQTLK
jgi:hypothetical protein